MVLLNDAHAKSLRDKKPDEDSRTSSREKGGDDRVACRGMKKWQQNLPELQKSL